MQMHHQAMGLFLQCATVGPVGRIPLATPAFERSPKRMIRVARPAADDQTILVEDPIKESIESPGILREFSLGVSDSSVAIVTVDFQDRAGCVRKRNGTPNGVGC